ncbi:MAG: hypothetical protein ACFCVH_10790 [Alphaproteobacteria bacterium]
MPGFQIGEVFIESLRFLFKQLRAAFVLAVVPYGLLLGLTVLASGLMPDDLGTLELRPGAEYQLEGLVLLDPATGESLDLAPILWFQLLMFILALVVPLPFKVAWLRYTLLGPRFQPVRPVFRFGDRELRFLGYTVGLTLIMLAIGGVGGAVAGMIGAAAGSLSFSLVLTLASIALLAWITARLYFVFPAVVMDLPGGFRRAWVESSGQALKLIVLTVIILLVLGLPTILVGMLLAGAPPVAVVVGMVLQIVIDAGLWTALGFAYWRTTGIPGPQGPTPPAVSPGFDPRVD